MKIKWIVLMLASTILGSAVASSYKDDVKHYTKEKVEQKFNPYVVDFERIKTVHIINLSASNKMEWFDRKFLDEPRVHTGEQFYQAIMNHYYDIHDEIKQEWKVENEDLLKSLYFMNVVSNMWPYGNKTAINKPGCACTNEINPNAFPCETLFENNVEGYVYTKIGCCADSARVMRFLLNTAGIKNRYMLNPGHVFNEVYIGNWQGLDATTNMWWRDSWENIQNAETHYHFSVSIFPMYAEVLSHPFYRQIIGVFRHYMLLEGVYKMAKDIKHPDQI